MKNGFRIAILVVGFMAIASALFLGLHQIRLALWPRSEYQKQFSLPGTGEPAWGPWLVVALPVLLIFIGFMYRHQIKIWVQNFLNK